MSSFLDRVRQARNQREASFIIAEALDEILARLIIKQEQSEWDGGWQNPEPPAPPLPIKVTGTSAPAPVARVQVAEQDGKTIFDMPPANPAKQFTRRQFAERVLELHNQGDQTLMEPADAIRAYVLAGPLWLYQNRELFMSYDTEVRRAMVQDVEEDDPEQAYLLARDVLQYEDSDRGGAKLARLAEGVGVQLPE